MLEITSLAYMQPPSRLRGFTPFVIILLILFTISTLIFAGIWLVVRLRAQGFSEIYGRLALGSFFVCILLLVPTLTDLILLWLRKAEFTVAQEYALEIKASNWAFQALLETILFALVLVVFGIVLGGRELFNLDLNEGLPKLALLFLLVFILDFGGHFMNHAISTVPSAQHIGMKRIAEKEANILYPLIYVGGFAGFVYGTITNQFNISALTLATYSALAS